VAIDVESFIQGFANRSDDQDTVALAESLTAGKRRAEAAALVKAASARILDPDKKIQSGCIKLLYEIGYREPSLIAGHAELFVRLLKNRNNRLVWGGMIALSTIARSCPEALFERRVELLEAIRGGSTITQDRGMMTLGLVAAADPRYLKELFPKLLAILRGSEAKDLPKFGEHLKPALSREYAASYVEALESRLNELPPPAQKRVGRLLAYAASLEEALR